MPVAPRPQGVSPFQPGNAFQAGIIRHSSSTPRSSFTLIDANRVAVNVAFRPDGHRNVVSM